MLSWFSLSRLGNVVLDQSFKGWGCRLESISPVMVGGRKAPSPARLCKVVVTGQGSGRGRVEVRLEKRKRGRGRGRGA